LAYISKTPKNQFVYFNTNDYELIRKVYFQILKETKT
jgi:hypothetical protein